jgi:RNA polymerase sigma factor (sigma-70 family)
VPAASVTQSLGLLRTAPVEREFERLYQRYVADVYRYAVYVLRDRSEAEDVTQAAFLNAFRAYQRGERPHKPRSWLLTIVHNECKRHFRSKSRRPSEVELDEGLTADLAPDDDVPKPEEIRRALGELSFNQRSALVMRELEGRSYAEIAKTLKLSVSAVETLLFRARRAMREQLEGALSCGEAELALSRQLDKRLSSDETASLRAHLRACKECSRLARRQRAQRTALRSLGPVPLPGSLTSLFGGGGGTTGGLLSGASAFGGGVALKAAAVLAGGAVATSVGMGAARAVGGGDSAPGTVAPLRQAALAPAAALGGPAAAVASDSGDGAFGWRAVGIGPFGAQLLADDVAAAAGGGEDASPPAAGGPEARPTGQGGGAGAAGGERPKRTKLLPRPGIAALPKLSVPETPQVKVPVPVPTVRVPSVPVPKPRIVPTPPVPPVTVPTVPTVPTPPVVEVPPVQPPPLPPLLPPPPKLP